MRDLGILLLILRSFIWLGRSICSFPLAPSSCSKNDINSMASPRLLPQVSNAVFLLQKCNNTMYYDVPNPGVSWYLIEREGPEQTEYETHESWCRPMTQFRGAVEQFLKVDLVENEKCWVERGASTG